MKFQKGDLVRRDYNGDRPRFVYGIALNDADRSKADPIKIRWLYYDQPPEDRVHEADQVFFVERAYLSVERILKLVRQAHEQHQLVCSKEREMRKLKRAYDKAQEAYEGEKTQLSVICAVIEDLCWPKHMNEIREIFNPGG